jgi:hypothetical protein
MAAPLVAGVAALVLSHDPSLGPAQVMDQLRYTAEHVNAAEHPGHDGRMGFGRVNAYQALSTPPCPMLSISSQCVNDAAGNANGRADPGETVALTVTLANAWADATSVAATLTSADPCVSVADGTASFGPIAAGAAASNATSPFVLQVPAGCLAGERISVALEVRTNGLSGVLSVPLPIGYPPMLFVSDDGGAGRLPYTEALDALDIPYDVWDVPFDADGTPASELAHYGVVIWDAVPVTSGLLSSNSLSAADVAALTTYLDGAAGSSWPPAGCR